MPHPLIQTTRAADNPRTPYQLFSHAVFMDYCLPSARSRTGRRNASSLTNPSPASGAETARLPTCPLIDLLTAASLSSPGPSSGWLLLFVYSACLCLGTRLVLAFDCDFIRVSSEDGMKNGSFTAPLINGHPIPPQGIQCIYTFIALPHERVKLTFRDFHLAGRPPECFHEYVDLYTELRNASEDLVQTDKFGGRFCGRIPPRTRVSLHNTIVVVFSSDRNLSQHVFTGTYEFINGSMYELGTRSQPGCDFVIKSWVNRLGEVFTPTYPGVYPQRIMCTYQLMGQRGQRVRIEFMDFDVFFGGSHCPYDRLTIYDGPTEQDPIIDAYCGPRRNLVVFSSQENLFISFITNRSGGENRGFHALFEFSELFVNLEFISGEHLRGTECDQRILSHGRNTGIIKSPNSPFPYLPNVDCRYVIEGLNNADDLERVILNVEMFHMPQPLGAAKGDCSAGGLMLWLEGREGGETRTLCGTHAPKEAIVSKDSKLVLKFYSGSTQGLGFTIRYQFETFFAVPGTPHPISTTCEFRYRSAAKKEGEFRSPRHPSNYPSNTNCTYIFEGEENEQAHIEFDHFKLSDGNGTYALTCDRQDYVDLYELLPAEMDSRGYREIGRYCGAAGPAPVKSRYGVRSLKMHFVTNAAGVTNGFRGRYWFARQIPTFHPDRLCGNITNGTHGTIESPNYDGKGNKYPTNSDCEWHIHVRPGHSVLINITDFSLEGDQKSDKPSGCMGAALKIYTDLDKYPVEVCGEALADVSYHSHGSQMKLLFTSAKQATGSRGFALTWNEFHYPRTGIGSGCEEAEFYCPKHSYCISSQRVCDQVYHCGLGDAADESAELCGTASEAWMGLTQPTLGAVVGAVVGGVVVAVVVAVCLLRRNAVRRRKRQMEQRQGADWSS